MLKLINPFSCCQLLFECQGVHLKEVTIGFPDPQKVFFSRFLPFSFNRGNKYKEYLIISPGPLNRGARLSQRKSSTVYLALLHLFLTTSTQKYVKKIGYKYNTTTNKNIQSFISRYKVSIDGLDQNSVFC